MTCHSTQSGVLGKASNHMAVIDFHGRKVDIDVLHASLAYHVEIGFDLRAKLIADGFTAAVNGNHKGIYGQGLESLFGNNDPNNDTGPDFSDWKKEDTNTELKTAPAKKNSRYGWIPAGDIKLQSQKLDLLVESEQSWETFEPKFGSVTFALRSQQESEPGDLVKGPRALAYETKLVRALHLDLGKCSPETASQIFAEYEMQTNMLRESAELFQGDSSKAFKQFYKDRNAAEKAGQIKFLRLVKGKGDRGQWVIPKSFFLNLLEAEEGQGLKDCARGNYQISDLQFKNEVYASTEGLTEEEIREKLDPESKVRSDPNFAGPDKKQRTKRLKSIDYDTKRTYCADESCGMALGLAQPGPLCDSCI